MYIKTGLSTLLFLISLSWIFTDIVTDYPDQESFSKILQTQRILVENYYQEKSYQELYRNGIREFVQKLSEKELDLKNTPFDTASTYDAPRTLRESVRAFENAYLYLSNNIVITDIDEFADVVIKGMLKNLDPHTVYIPKEQMVSVNERFAGEFEGIGIEFNIIRDTITVVTAISGGPSDQLGITTGDRIIEIDGESAIGLTTEDVSSKLRGDSGSIVNVRIKRPQALRKLRFSIERAKIPLRTIDAYYMLDEQTGYIKLNRFAATTYDEFMASVKELKSQNMERLILDLENNPGGFMNQGLAITKELFPSGTKIVSTESRHRHLNLDEVTDSDGKLMNLPLIILVNRGSASASEILSGAVQDHDRGLIVGNRTFGKGLVQNQFQLVDGSGLRVTISRYKTPSGRYIQKSFSGDDEEYAFNLSDIDGSIFETHKLQEEISDSLQFKTSNGRVVYGGGGIMPDFIYSERDLTDNKLLPLVLSNRMSFHFVREFLDTFGEEFEHKWGDEFSKFRNHFELDDEMKVKFNQKLLNNGMVIDEHIEEILFENDKLVVTQEYIDEHIDLVYSLLKSELAGQFWGRSKYFMVVNDYLNEMLWKANELWVESERIHELTVQKL